VINDGNHTYTYDAENRMITVGGSTQAYFYDAFGRQTQTIYSGNTYSRIFGLNGRAEVQFSGNTWMLSELYAGSIGAYLGNYSNNTTYFAHNANKPQGAGHPKPTITAIKSGPPAYPTVTTRINFSGPLEPELTPFFPWRTVQFSFS
jgi:hypothetical protein